MSERMSFEDAMIATNKQYAEALAKLAKGETGKRLPIKQKRSHPEQDEQERLFVWIRAHELDYPELKHVRGSLNGVFLHPNVAKTAYKMGMRKGEWDVFIDIPKDVEVLGGRYFRVAGMYIEMKWGKNTLTVEQESFRTDRQRTHEFRVCYSAKSAAECILDYLWELDMPSALVRSLSNPIYFAPEEFQK